MSDCGKKIRLNRILHGLERRALVVAFDHALVLGPIRGTDDPLGQIRRFSEANVDGLLLNLGVLRQCADASLPANMPGLIVRIDWTTVWGAPTQDGDGALHSCRLARPEDALRHGADAVLTYLVIGSGDSDFETKEVARTAEVARECERLGIPLIVESLARGKQVENHRDPKWLGLHTRMAAELGADVVKTDYTGNPETMRGVVDACLVPILVLGGSRCSDDEEALQVVRGVVTAAAAGVFFGRNVFQAEDMLGFLKRARAVLDGTEAVHARS